MTGTHDEAGGSDGRLVALVTGATGAIGRAIAERIADRPGYEVVLLGRDAAKAEAAVAHVQHRSGNPNVRYELADVARRRSITALAERWSGRAHVLVNTAAITPRGREETPEGIERQLATNVLGYFWMIEAFRERLAEAAPARVVNVASYWAGGLDLDDLEFKHRRYDNDAAYRQSKQGDRMLTVAFAERLKGAGISVNACHPGDVVSTLSRSLGFGGHETADEAARTPAWLATEATGGTVTGRYFEHTREVRCRFGEDREAVEALYRACEAYH
ncbi:MAG: SDR family NAD(P)-dependent oxidoreductase [Chromatiaceae bacterium]|jgi:NAD(P)-dependent dehydrogenase (short-subunit alcohol dehydrogenase family)